MTILGQVTFDCSLFAISKEIGNTPQPLSNAKQPKTYPGSILNNTQYSQAVYDILHTNILLLYNKGYIVYLKLKSSAMEDLLFLSDKLLPNPGYTGGRDILGILSSVSSLSLLSLSSLAVRSLSLSSLAICSLSRNSRSNGKTGRFGGSTKKISE